MCCQTNAGPVREVRTTPKRWRLAYVRNDYRNKSQTGHVFPDVKKLSLFHELKGSVGTGKCRYLDVFESSRTSRLDHFDLPDGGHAFGIYHPQGAFCRKRGSKLLYTGQVRGFRGGKADECGLLFRRYDNGALLLQFGAEIGRKFSYQDKSRTSPDPEFVQPGRWMQDLIRP